MEVGDILRKVEQVEADIVSLQTIEDREGGLPESDLTSLRARLALHHSLLLQQDIFWRQRSQIQWLREGDRNTIFFHQATLKRRAANRIHRIVDEGHCYEDIQVIRDLFLQFYQTRWSEHSGDGYPVHPVPSSKKATVHENGLLHHYVLA